MSMEMVRRARALRLCKEILGNESRADELEGLIHALEKQSTEIESLLRHEESLRQLIEPNPKVVPLQQKKTFSLPIPKMKIFDKRFVIESPCLIEGSTADERKKLAFEIHSRSRKAIFVDLENLECIWNSDLLGLEDSTLFIPEIRDLSVDQQSRLLALFKLISHPLVIAATESHFGALKEDQRVSRELLLRIAQAHFRLQRPVKEYMEMGFFKLFLESLS